jgi:hypothetical protein
MVRLAVRWRVAVLVAMGAWMVHQLRYLLLPAGDEPGHAQAHAHQYLDFAGPLLAWALAAALATWVASLARSDELARDGVRARAVWARAVAALVVIYSVQESVEGLLAPGHPNVLLGVFGHGGWIALPLAILVGGGLALLLRGSRAVREVVARARRVVVALARPVLRVALPRPVDRVRPPAPLATKLAGRAPPRTV